MYSVQEVKRNCCLLKNESQPLLKNPFNYISSLHFFLLNSFSIIFIAVSKIKLILVNWLLEVNRLLRSCCMALPVMRWGVGCILFAELSGHAWCCWKELLHFGLVLAFLLSIFQTSCEYLYMFSCTALSAYFVTMHPPFISLQYPSNKRQTIFCSEGWMTVICLKPSSKSSALARNGFLS